MPKRHYTDHSAPTCCFCDRDTGDLCHVHDPAMRKYLKDGYFDVDDADEELGLAWTTEPPTERGR